MEQLMEAILQALLDAGFAAERAWPGLRLPELTAPVTAVGLNSARTEGGTQFTYLGTRTVDGEETAVYGSALKAEAALTVFCPVSQGGESCLEVAEGLMQLLCSGIDGVRIRNASVGPCRFDSASGYLVCTVSAEADAWLYALANEDETEFTDFILKGVAK